jgi:cytochrome c oxidase cbb3-type subunit 3
MRRIAAAVVALALLVGCRPQADPLAAAERTHELGRKVYNFRCYYCHGYSGDAQTVAAQYLVPPPRDFTRADAAALDLARLREAIANGRPNTAMKPFATVLTAAELDAVAAFVRHEFIERRAANTRYHTAANGWANHERYAAAFPFATREISLAVPPEQLTEAQQAGRRLFLAVCVTCHDQRIETGNESAWQIRPITYPPDFYLLAESGRVDADDAFDPHQRHEQAPAIGGLTARQKRGAALYANNCAHCHAEDGSGRNWRGAFLEPHPPDFTLPRTPRWTQAQLVQSIAAGKANSSMPAFGAVLTRAEMAAIAAYMARAFPAAVSFAD